MECIKPLYLPKQDLYVPCGKCPFCAATKRSDWATRLEYEARLHRVKKFVTLTYADAHLHWAHGKPQLDKRDVQLWLKRVRKTGAKVRYYAVGEYGSQTYRPHYHVILFGDVSDEVIREAWPLGLVHIGTVTQQSIMYCLGYIVNAKAFQMVTHRVRPFALMSTRPGIGANYLSPSMIQWHRSDRRAYVLLDGVRRHLPKYYKERIFSKIDRVRIAVYTGNAMFLKQVEWIRQPSQMLMKDPLAYRREQQLRLAKQIRAKSKENLSI